MPWGRMDDKFHRNAKVRALRRLGARGREALGAWVYWWSWCLDDGELTGFVPSDELPPADARAALLLVEVGLWDETEGGYVFHDFAEYNPKASDIEAKRKADRERVAAKRAASRENVARDSQATSTRVASTRVPSHPIPSHPIPVPSESEIATASPAALTLDDDEPIPTIAAWTAYRDAYARRYGVEPVRNAKINSQLKQFCSRVPAADAVETITAYLRSQNARYVASGHSVGCLLQDAEKLRTEAVTGRQSTSHGAREADKRAGRGAAYDEMLARLDAEDRAEGRA